MQPNQWQQQQYPYNGGFQPQQTGFQPQRPSFQGNPRGGSFMSSQPTGFQQPMQTGFNQQRPPSMLPSGGGANMSFLSQPPPSNFRQPGMNPQMTGYPGGGASGLMSQQTGFQGGGFISQPTGMGMGGGMMSQPTGMGGLRPQPTGIQDPRLQSMMQSFMPSNLSQPFNPSGTPQFNPTPQHQPLTQTFQTLLQNPSVRTPKVPWTLSRQEKKDYDQIFRAWDTDGDGFITGETAREVFGQAGLGQEALLKIWNLSDVDNRGKLNLPEFHVAMGLIYRALNGNDIPDTLPEELVPASMRDIDTTVNFMRELLKHDASTRSNASSPSYGGTPVPAPQSKDATMYKHDDSRSATYKPSSRHLDRKSVRYAGEDSSADIGDIRRQLQNTSALLDRSNEDSMRRSAEDEELEQEMDDLKYKVKRIQDDIEYVSKGRRTQDKDEERRKLERELLFLMHEKLPELERRQQQRDDEKRMEERAGVRARDKRNDTHGRYGRDDRDDDLDWLRGTYDRDDYGGRNGSSGRRDSRDRGNNRYDRERSRDRDRSLDRDSRPRSPPNVRSPPPAPPAASTSNVAVPPPAPPVPTSQAAAAPSTRNMSAEQRTAFIREQAQRRIQDRLKALGVESPASDQPAVDKSVEERLEREKQEAAEKTKKAEAEQEARDQARQARLAGAGGLPEASKLASKPAKVAPTPPKPRPGPVGKQAPPPPISRQSNLSKAPPSPTPVAATAEDPEETEIRRKEEAMQKAREERKKRLQELEKEEAEERRKEEEMLAARQSRNTASQQPTPPAVPSPPVAPPMPTTEKGHNPFRKPNAGVGATPSPGGPAPGGFNPFFKAQPAAEPSASLAADAPPPPPPPAPPPPSAQQARAAFSPPPQEDWEQVNERDANESDSSDDDHFNSRAGRSNLASALFGNLTSPTAKVASAVPSVVKAIPAALTKLGGGGPSAGMGGLLSAIQAGTGLRKAQTVDKSAPPGTGRVIGGVSPSPLARPELEQDNSEDSFTPSNSHRQSVDWYAGLAADQSHPSASRESGLDSTQEEDEPNTNGDAPEINVSNGDVDDLSEFDLSKSLQVRTLYAYDGQREVDLSFKENVVIVAHPAKDPSSPWWYGQSLEEGKKGWFPHSYVEEMTVTRAKATYAFDGGSEEELPFAEGDTLDIVDTSDSNWWKTEKAGVIFIVPASYLEIIDSNPRSDFIIPSPRIVTPVPQAQAPTRPPDSPQPRSRPDPMLAPDVLTDTRPRSSSINSASDEGDESSDDDSVLSWWSSDESDEEVDEGKEAERRRREAERQKMLASAGLQLRREPPGVPARPPDRKVSRRRPAPAAPKKRRQAPAVPSSSDEPVLATPPPERQQDPVVETQDAYARYESFLSHSTSGPSVRSPPERPVSVVSPKFSGTPSPTSAAMTLAPSKESTGGGGGGGGGRLSGFFSRMIAPTVPAEKERTKISGPIITRVETRNEDDGQGGEDGEFGKTWSSLVDPGVLESMGGKERKRQEAIFEFIATESTYNRDLQLVVEVFYASLLDKLDDKALTVIFANVEDILLGNTAFLSSLEQRQKSCRLYVDVVGNILEEGMPGMEVYTTYCVNQQQASRLLQSLRQSDPALTAHLQSVREMNPSVRGLDLSSFLLIPMQRITRYPLLLKQIIKYTEPDQDLDSVQNALHTVESIVATINESVREAEAQDRLRALSEDLWIGGEGRLDLTAPTQFQGPRRLLKEGAVMKAKSGRKLTLVLCNDILVLIESRNLYRMPIPLFDLSVRAGRDDTSFALKINYQRGGGDTIGLKAPNAREAKEWVAMIEKARMSSVDSRKGGMAMVDFGSSGY